MYGQSSALLQRNFARRVRQTASLVSGHDKIREKQGENWAADCKNRIIYWRVTHPFKENTVLNEDQVLWLTIHEASHLVLSGSFDVPEPPIVDNQARFFRFYNAVEDIRIERWAVKRFPGKGYACAELHRDASESLREIVDDPDNPGLHISDQVGRMFICMENNINIWGEKKAKKFAVKHWHAIDRIVSESYSSAQLAEKILPIYQELMDIMPPSSEDEEDPNDGDIVIDADDFFRSADKDGNPARQLTWKEILDGMSKDAKGETKKRLIIKCKNEEQAEDVAKKLAEISNGKQAGSTDSGISGDDDSWINTVHDNRGAINILSRRLQTRLEHNAADEWETRLKRGQFNSGHAYRSLRGDTKIFRKKHAIGKSDYDFCITVDMSGSQGGRERQLLATCVTAAEAIENCGMGLSIITWDNSMRHWKGWYDSIKKTRGNIGYDLGHAGGGTYEANALRVAEELIRHRLNMGRSVFLITLTDGQTGGVEESITILNDMKTNGVNSIGVGVMCPPPDHYDTKIQVNTSDELVAVLPNLLKGLIKRG